MATANLQLDSLLALPPPRGGLTLSALWDSYRRSPTPEVREHLARHYIGLVHHMARQLSRRSSLDAAELIGSGSLGLLRALERFDVSRGLAFSTYAVQCIRGAMLDDLRKRDWMPRGIRARSRRIAAARTRLEAKLHRAPTAAEVAAELKLSLASYWRWLDEVGVTPGNAGGGPGEYPSETGVTQPEGELDLLEVEERGELQRVLATLPPRLQQVIWLLYFEELTARQVAGVLGVTESRVSQLRKRALDEMRARLRYLHGMPTGPVRRRTA